jgi:hypothetical protein
MKVVILLAIAILAQAAPATTTIADTVVLADGSRFNGNIVITWLAFTAQDGSSVPAGSKVAAVVGGLLRTQLVPYNAYTATFEAVNGYTSRQNWAVPQSATPVRLSDLYSPPVLLSSGVYQQAVAVGMSSLSVSAAQHGCGANPFWRVWDSSAGWTDVDAVLDTSGNLVLTWEGSFTGFVRIACGSFAPNYSATFSTADSALIIPGGTSGILSTDVEPQCYDASGNYFDADFTLSLFYDLTIAVNPDGSTPIAGRCIAGAH